jgi:hypothetical protein
MSKEEVLTMDRAVWEQMRYINEKAQIKKRYDFLLDLMEDCIGED